MAHALVVTRHGGREVLEVQPQERPTPGEGEVLVEVAASGVNFIDVYQREGVYPLATPFTLGMEGAGRVLETGPGVEDVAVGDIVAWAMTTGSAASYAVLPARVVVPVPEGVDPVVAAAAMLQGMTAQFLTTDTYPVRPGTVALVHAAAGGVGQLLVQMLKAKGATVVATAGSQAKCETARARGADHVIDYSQVDDLAAAVRAFTPDGRGVDVAYDGVGASTFDASLASLRPRGTLAIFGAASGAVPPVDVQRLNAGGSLFLTRPSLAHHVADRGELLARAGEVLGAVADGSLEVAIGGRYPLTDAGAAYEALEGRATEGKLVLIP
ncbi:MAG TPA: quinone oxidoreductase [Phycicoccus elongatus]|uniref:quinone oxidoreductase family protein n=1 Tax=Phycicoccus elongatus TaxID=101689 RepID=UPI002D05712A|nr:quinone oxidoreductase [Phycicoccus elongatus]MCB9406712.1 quinone oxidoreductase [Tetrasphaera sp.]HPK12073.1 quinone oxidoreductase [Phycicoccus elongatus]HPQ72503.1 quinone oxidoreductase [Phycicoccus elongatus]HRC16929.1 quinone oxidoreductase [Phycicoccus elongatus]